MNRRDKRSFTKIEDKLVSKLEWISGYLCENTRFNEFQEVKEWGIEVDKLLELYKGTRE